MTTDEVERINKQAWRRNSNRALAWEFVETLDPEGIHVVAWTMVHNDREIRARIMFKVKNKPAEDGPVEGWLDMSFKEFEDLQRLEYERSLTIGDEAQAAMDEGTIGGDGQG